MISQSLICQSCGMPMQEDTDFGTNEDQSPNKDYCIFCFKDGGFLEPDITMDKKINKVIEIATNYMGMGNEEAKEMANNIIPKLKRWQKANER